MIAMKHLKLLIYLIIFIIISNVSVVYCQSNFNSLKKKSKKELPVTLKKMQKIQRLKSNQSSISEFKIIERAISDGDISRLTGYFNSRTYLSLANGVSGYYSNNQVYYVLKNYFIKHSVKTFNFTKIEANVNTPFAIGSYDFNSIQGRKSLRVYISLKNIKNEWKILQITIN